MGEVVRKSASVEFIFADVQATLRNAEARGGLWWSLAQERLVPIVALVRQIEQQITEAEAAVAPLVAVIDAQDEVVDRLLGRVSDDIWNAVGRPASDPALTILFPAGVAYYAEGATGEQPERMEVLAELLDRGVHPKLSADKAKAFAKEIRDGAATLRSAVENARPKLARAQLTTRVRTALARTAQSELSNLKRRYKAESFSEADIHAVIPDRSTPTPKKAPAPPTPAVPHA